MAARKTVKVQEMREHLNALIARWDNADGRRALCAAVENMLMDAKAYHGFSYIGGWQGIEEYKHHYF